MERMGPRGGDIVDLNLILAGASSIEVDYIGSLVMGYGLSEVKHLRYAIECNGIDVSRIEPVGEGIEDVRYSFKMVSINDLTIPS